MIKGDLIIPKYGLTDCTLQAAEKGHNLEFIPFTPDANTVCTISAVVVGESGRKCIFLEEVKCRLDGKFVPFVAEYWTVLDTTEESVDEAKNLINQIS